MAQSNEERIRIANEVVIGKGNLDVVDDFFTANYVVHTSGTDYTGTEFVRRFIKQLRSAIPDIRVVNVEFFVEAGDRNAEEWAVSELAEKLLLKLPRS